MTKVGILTINDYSNYGNRLQNYALQEVLQSLDCEVETVVQERNSLSYRSHRKLSEKIKGISSSSNSKKIKIIKEKINSKIFKKYILEKRKNLKDFTNLYIKESSIKISVNDIPSDLVNKYDYFITGSDQVWNPMFSFGNEIDFIQFAPKEKRISYAASFGISELPDEDKRQFKNRIMDMEHLSVREEAGAKIIKELTGKESSVLVDPTLLLSKQQWLSISSPHNNKPRKPYLLTYILGDISEEEKQLIEEVAKKNNLLIVNLASFKDKKRYTANPSEFIDYFNNASSIFTNSFHGAVFSILLEKPFVVMNRSGMNSRVNTLLSKFDLESRKYENIVLNKSLAMRADFQHVHNILVYERKKSTVFLKEALNIR